MKSNIVILDLDIYQKEVEDKTEALTKLASLEKELEALNTLIEDLKKDRELLNNELRELLDGIIDDHSTIYNDEICNFNIKDRGIIADFLTDKGYLLLIKEIKARKEAKNNE